MNLSSVVYQTAEAHLSTIREDGSMPPGHNGLYNDAETPVRNTSHWLLIFSSIYEQTGEDRFENAAYRTIEYLLSSKARPNRYTFHHRKENKKDKCNGLIGQAWTIEALATASRIFADAQLTEIAEQVFLSHPHDQRTGLWKRVEIDGQTLPFDATFNHQLWFAAAGGLLAEQLHCSSRVDTQVRRFLNELDHNLQLYPSGLIFHPLKPPKSLSRLAYLVRNDIKYRIGITFFTSSIPLQSRQRRLRRKAIGYHSFNLYAFALLKRQYPDHNFWKTKKWTRAVKYITKSEYRNRVWENKYGSPYNPIGFEVPFVMEVFNIGTTESRRQWITRQLNSHYNIKTNRMEKNTEDTETLTARTYQATRLKDISLPEIKSV